MFQPKAEVMLKFQRSLAYADKVYAAVSNYLGSNPYQIIEYSEGGDLVSRIKIAKEIPSEISLDIGDAIHNARVALDHLAWQLVINSGGTPNKNTCFPIYENESRFNRAYKDKLKGANKTVLATIEQLKPYKGGADIFWTLHNLDIEDKHHLLIAVGAAHKNLNLHMQFKGFENEPVYFPPIALKPADNEYPLVDGKELFRIKQAAITSNNDFINNYSFTFELLFGNETSIGGQPIIPKLKDLILSIESSTKPLVDLLHD